MTLALTGAPVVEINLVEAGIAAVSEPADVLEIQHGNSESTKTTQTKETGIGLVKALKVCVALLHSCFVR